MNKIYRAIWNETTQTWVAASELAKSRTKSDTVSSLPAAASVSSKSKLGALFKLGLIASFLNMSLLSSHVYAANAAIIGGSNVGDNSPHQNNYKDQQGNLLASHGSIILNGANDFAADGSPRSPYTCGADEVQGRGVTGRTITGTEITALDEYLRFAKNQAFDGKNPYGTTSDATNANNAAMQGKKTGGAESKMPVAYGVYSFASGCGSFTTGNYSMAFGTNATALAGGAMAIGTAALASGRASIAFGVGAEATGVSSVALGSVASSNGVGSVAAGLLSQAKADGTVALGVQAQALQHSAVAIGNAAQATGEQSISIGSANQVSGKASGAIGGSAETTSYDKDNGTQKTAATGVTIVTGDGSYSFGNQNGTIAANNTGVFGNYNTIETDSTGTDKADNIRILGNHNTVSAKASGAMIVGNRANVSAVNGLALGNNTKVSATNGVALGEGAMVSVDGGVALGSGSVASTGSGAAGFNPDASAETAVTPVWKSTANAVAIGDAANGHTRQITGLAAGTQDTDAVNVAQLKSLSNATSNSIASLSTSAESSLGTVNEKLTELSNSASSSILSTSNKLNSLSTSVDTHINDTQIALDELQRSTSTSIQHLQEDALQWNAGENAYDAAHLASGAKTAKIINVTAGDISSATSTDAVNGGQLYTTNVSLSTLDTKVSDGLQTLREQMNNLNIADIGSLSTVASNISTDVASLQSNALLWKNGAYDASHNDAPQKITNVEAGSIAQGSTDAINGGQLYSLSTATVTNLAEITAKLDDNDNKITEVKNQALLWNQSLNNGEGAYDARDRKITGVASGALDATSSDVVIGAQLHETNTAVSALSTSTSTGLHSLSTALQDSSTSIINSLSSLVDGSNGDIAALQKTALQWSSADQAYSAKYENENQRITNVLETELASNSTDVATGNQLYTLSTATQESLTSLSSSLNGISADGVKSLSTGLSTANSNITTLQQDALQWNGQAYDASHGVTDGRGKITNVADADLLSTSSDVVTGGQLFTTNSNLSSLSSTVNTELNNLSQSTSTSINSLSTALNDFADNAVGSLSTVFDNKLAATHSSLSSLQQNALLWNADLGAYDATHNGQAQRITNVQAGDATAGSSDVVTGGQLFTTNSQLSYLSGSVSTTLNSLSSSLQNISDTSLAGLTNELSDTNRKLADLSLSTSMSFISTNANIESLQQNALLWNEDLNNGSGAYDAGHGGSSAQLITHVRAGAVAEDSTDAINGSQLFSLSSSTSTGLSSLSTSLQTFTDAQMGDLGKVTNKLNTVESNVVALQGNALQWNSNSGTEGAFDATRGGKSQQLTGIANGAISETSTDAINGMQMHSLSTATSSSLSSLSSNLNDSLGSTNQNLTALQQNAMQWNNSLKAYDASHNINGEAVAQRITNVAAGQEATDAVNFGQLSTLSSSTSSSVNSLSTAVSTAMTAEIGNITNITNSLSSGYSGLLESLSTTNDSLNNLVSDTNTRIESLSTGYVEMHNNVAKLQEDSQNNLRWNSEYNGGEGAFDASKPGSLTRASEPGKIINVADGDISEHSHDAVTGGQLFTVKSDLASLSTATSSSLSSINNVLQIGGISSSISSLQVNALQWDNSLHAYNASYNGDPQRITNVKAGQETTDAVNFGQLSSVQNDLANLSTRVDNLPTDSGISQEALNSLSTALSNQISSITSGLGASYNPSENKVALHDYEITKPDGSKEIVNDVAKVLENMQNNGTMYARFGPTNNKPGAVASSANSIALGGSAQAREKSAIAIGSDATASVENGVALGKGAAAMATGGIALGAESKAKRKGGEKQEVYVPGTATDEQRRVIEATQSADDWGAVSVGDEDNRRYRQITGVAAGSENTDAVNVAQLKGVNNKIDNINKYVNKVNERLQRTERRAYSGTALAMALSGAYLPSLNAGEQAVGVGVGTYRGYTAVGANYKAISNSGNIGWGAGVSTTGKEVGFNGGVGFKWSSN